MMPAGNWTVAICKQWNRIWFEKNGSRRVEKQKCESTSGPGASLFLLELNVRAVICIQIADFFKSTIQNPKIKSNTQQERLSSRQKTAFIAPALV